MSTPAHIPTVAADIANAKTKKLKAKYDRCIESLKFYADIKNHELILVTDEQYDRGFKVEAIAQQVLKECGE